MGIALADKAAVGEVNVVVVHGAQLRAALFCNQRIVEADPVARRIGVELADRKRLVARSAKRAGERGHAFRHGQGGLEGAIAVGPRVCPVISVRRAGMQIGHSE